MQTGNDELLDVAELVVRDPGARHRLIWFGYVVAGTPVAGDLKAKIYQVFGALRRRWDAQIWLLSVDCSAEDCAPARARLGDFMRETSPQELAGSIAAPDLMLR